MKNITQPVCVYAFVIMKRILLLITVFAISISVGAQSTQQKDLLTITFTPDHSNWIYNVDDSVTVKIAARRYNVDLPNQEILCEWGMEMSKAEQTVSVNTSNSGVVTLRLPGSSVPGFKTLSATTTYDNKKYKNYITLAFEPERIQPTVSMPSDFQDFWDDALQKARKNELDPLIIPQDELSTPYSKAYMVRFTNYKYGAYIYGILKVPVEQSGKPMPALLEVPGAGVRRYQGASDDYAKAGIVTLQIGIHGIPVNLPGQLYTDLARGALSHYNDHSMDNRDEYYYHSVVTGCVRAVDFLMSLNYVKKDRIAVYGGSQGGYLSLVVAALAVKNIYCVSAAYPAMSEISGSTHGRIDGWPRLFTGKSDVPAKEKKIQVMEYYDAVNFARLVKAPMLFIQGYNDKVCPPTTTMAVYNTLSCPKEMLIEYDAGHWLYSEHWNYRRDWLIDHLTQ